MSMNSLQPEDDQHSIATPLFAALREIGWGEFENFHHFQTRTLFWSMVRLFGSYERIMSVLKLERSKRPFLEADIESFIIRFQIVLNDIAFLVRQLLPEDVRGLRRPPSNGEMSFMVLMDYFAKNSDYPEFKQIFSDAAEWMLELRERRNDVVHYKAQVVVFESDPPSFAFHNASGPKKTELTENGGERVVTVAVGPFVNDQLLALHKFMEGALVKAILQYAHRTNMKFIDVAKDGRMSTTGIARFKKLNGLQ